jgi:ribosomal protein S18 acetylase RimI-like enzyme
MWTVRPVPHDQWPALADFIHAHNRRPDGRVRCLHAEHGASAQDQADELRSLPAQEACFVAAHDGQTLRGVAGAEFDARLSRAWLRGPLTDRSDDAPLRAALIAALHDALPQAQRFDAFPQIDEAALRDSLRNAGYREHVQHHVMHLHASASVPTWPAAVHDASPAEAAQAAALHETLFPATYLSGASMLASLDADHRLLVVTPAGHVQPAGYLYVQRQPLESEAYIDFVGVAPEARGLGHGRALLDAALHWAFVQRGLPGIALTVRQDRPKALRLYESAGFREVAAGAQMIFERAASSAA